MSDILSEFFNLVEHYAPEVPRDAALEKSLTDTMTPEQLALFQVYKKSEFLREEADWEGLFRFLLHIP